MDLSNLSPAHGATRHIKRVGRGPGSGTGKTAARGHKGRGSRSGGNTRPGYEGGQMPLQRRLPKRGFHNPFRREYSVVNLKRLEEVFQAGETIDPATMVSKGLARVRMSVKILADGQLTKPLTVRAHAFSNAARRRIEEAGGSAEVIGRA